jgi:hypothetical protein
MRFLILIVALASSTYFVEWIPNGAAAPPPPEPSQGEFPWQL